MTEGQAERAESLSKAERDVVALGIAVAAIILFVGTAGSLAPQVVQSWLGMGPAPDTPLTVAVLLNIALLIFGWRRYSDLQKEVAERRRAEANARALAETDPLTGCLNRRSGGPALEALLASAAQQGRDVTVLMADLDNFKHINDANGHAAGDAVLGAIAARIAGLLPDDGILARIGGDEFVCAVAHDERIFAESLAERLIDAISAPIDARGVQIEATVSVGLSSSRDGIGPDSNPLSDTLLHRADIAMYQAKKCGRNRWIRFEPRMEVELRQRAELESAIRRGIPAGEFVPYYEQQIDLETGELVGFEMLARWHSPQFGVLPPEVFISVAEEIDQIAELSESLIRQALKDASEWDPSLSLAINISPLQLRDPWFAQKLLKLLIDSGFPPSRLEVEITESCLHENIGAVRTIITSLKNQGIRISLDDFGTGYSSLSQLRSLPFDRLKIDRSFVADLAEEKNGHELVEAIVSLGRGLSLPITAEGVESPDILEALQRMGSSLKGQGYLYGRPEDADATRARLAGLDRLAREDWRTLAVGQGAAQLRAG